MFLSILVTTRQTEPKGVWYLNDPLHHRDLWEAISNHASALNQSKTRSTKDQTHSEWNVSPTDIFFLSNLFRGSLHVLLSSSVPLILPLILHCPHVKPKVHIQTDPGQQSRAYQSMKWKKKTTPSPSLPPCPALSETAQHLIELIKLLDQRPVMVSGPQ